MSNDSHPPLLLGDFAQIKLLLSGGTWRALTNNDIACLRSFRDILFTETQTHNVKETPNQQSWDVFSYISKGEKLIVCNTWGAIDNVLR